MRLAKAVRILSSVYAALCVAALGVFLLGLPGIAAPGEADPVAAIYAFLLALPWILLLDLLPQVPAWAPVAGSIAAMVFNWWLLRRLARWLERRGRG